jgi:hypothetical protein
VREAGVSVAVEDAWSQFAFGLDCDADDILRSLNDFKRAAYSGEVLANRCARSVSMAIDCVSRFTISGFNCSRRGSLRMNTIKRIAIPNKRDSDEKAYEVAWRWSLKRSKSELTVNAKVATPIPQKTPST